MADNGVDLWQGGFDSSCLSLIANKCSHAHVRASAKQMNHGLATNIAYNSRAAEYIVVSLRANGLHVHSTTPQDGALTRRLLPT
jgi:hypothetical protein